VGSSF